MSFRKILLSLFTCLCFLSWADGFHGEGWEVAFWSGARCTSEDTGIFRAENFPKGSKYCHAIPDIGVTKAMDLYAADPSYKFGLHRNSDCTDDPSQFIANSDVPSCIETSSLGGAVAFSVKRTRSRKARSPSDDASLLLEPVPALKDDYISNIQARDFIDGYTVSTVSASGGFGITAIQSCPPYYDSTKKGLWKDQTVCCISATGFVFFGFLSVYHNVGETEKANGATRRDASVPWYDTLDRITDFGILEDVHPLGLVTDSEGAQWDQYLYNITEHSTGIPHYMIYEHDHSADRHMLSAEQDTTQTGMDSDGLRKRDSGTYRAYYSWTGLQKKPFKKRGTSTGEVGHLVQVAWDFCRGSDSDVICANFRVKGQGQIGKGQFSITNGVFSPDFSSC